MAQAQVKPVVADVPPHQGRQGGSELDKYKTLSGFEGHEQELGRSMSILLKMLNNHAGYAHEMNDPLVKAHLLAIQHAKNKGDLAGYVAHDIRTMEPINLRMKQVIQKTGLKEIALVALFDRTACHYGLALTTEGDGPSRSWSRLLYWLMPRVNASASPLLISRGVFWPLNTGNTLTKVATRARMRLK